MRFYYKTKGAISIFLAIILTSIIILTGIVIDGSRIRAAEYQVKSALDISTQSVLTRYNKILKDQYGLFALSENDPQVIKEAITDSMNKILMTELGANVSKEDLKNFQSIMSLFITDKTKPSTDLFGYRVDDVKVTPLYNLTENEVIRNQIVEYMKYRAPKAIAEEIFDKLGVFKDLGRQSKVLQEKTKVDKELKNVRDEQVKLSDAVENVNMFNRDAASNNVLLEKLDGIAINIALWVEQEKLKEKLEADKQKLILDKEVVVKTMTAHVSQEPKPSSIISGTEVIIPQAWTDWAKIRSEIQAKIDAIQQEIVKLQSQIDQASTLIDINKAAAESRKSEISTLLSNAIVQVDTALLGIQALKLKSENVNKQIGVLEGQLKEDDSDFGNSVKVDVGGKKVQVDDKIIDDRKNELDANRKVLIKLQTMSTAISPPDIKTQVKNTTSKISANDMLPEVKASMNISMFIDTLKEYQGWCNDSAIPYSIPKGAEKAGSAPDPREEANKLFSEQETKGKALIDEINKQQTKGNTELEKYLPSSKDGKNKVNSNVSAKDVLEKDEAYLKRVLKVQDKAKEYSDKTVGVNETGKTPDFKDESGDSSNDLLSFVGTIGETISNGLRNMRDELYVNEYTMGTFKHYVSDKTPDKYFDNALKFPKTTATSTEVTRKTYFRNEIEYIIGGNIGEGAEGANVASVRNRILLTRFALNTIHIYMDPQKFQIAMRVAMALVGWSGFLVPIVHTLIMFAWSFAESVLDMNAIMEGKDVPIFKTIDTWILGTQGALIALGNTVKNEAIGAVKTMTDKAIDYTADKAQDWTKAAENKAKEVVNTKVGFVVNKLFKPIEGQVQKVLENVDVQYTEVMDKVETSASEGTNAIMLEINKKIDQEAPMILNEVMSEDVLSIGNSLIPNSTLNFEGHIEILKGQINKLNQEYTDSINGKTDAQIKSIRARIDEKKAKCNQYIFEVLSKIKKNLSDKIIVKISDLIKKLSDDVNRNITEMKDNLKEKAGSYFDSLEGKTETNKGIAKSNIKASFLSMGYEGYIRLFLMVMNRDDKMNRIEDLIQLNMNTTMGNNIFRISQCNTYLRTEASTAMKFLFMTMPFMPKGLKTEDNQYIVRPVVYKGY